MVPRFEKRVRAFAADISGLIIIFILTAFGLANIDDSIRSYIQAAILILTFFILVIFPQLTKAGQTFGKRLQKIKVVNMDGSNPSKFKLIGREIFKYFFSIATFGLYSVVAFFTLSEKHVSRTIHDYVFKTKVIDLDTSVQNVRMNEALQTKTMKETRLK